MFTDITSVHNANSKSLSGIVVRGQRFRQLLMGHKIRVMLMARMFLIDGELGMKDNKVVYESGAARSTMDVRWDLLCEEFIRDMAVVMKEGADKYADDNWKKGVPEGVTINHLLEHLYEWQAGDRGELHLAKVAVNAMFLDYYERYGVVVE